MAHSTYLERKVVKLRASVRRRDKRCLSPRKKKQINEPDARASANALKGERVREQSREAIISALEQFKRANRGTRPSISKVAEIAMVSRATVYRLAGPDDPTLHNMIKWRGKVDRQKRVDTAAQLERSLDVNSELEQRIKLLEGELIVQEVERKASQRRIAQLEGNIGALIGQKPVTLPSTRNGMPTKPKAESAGHLKLVIDSESGS